MNASVAIQVLPKVGSGDELIKVVDEVIAYIKSKGLKTVVGPFETTIEGDYDELMEIVKQCQIIAINAGALSVMSYVKINYSPGGDILTIDQKINKYNNNFKHNLSLDDYIIKTDEDSVQCESSGIPNLISNLKPYIFLTEFNLKKIFINALLEDNILTINDFELNEQNIRKKYKNFVKDIEKLKNISSNLHILYSLPRTFINKEGKVCYDIKLKYLTSYKVILDKLEEEGIVYYSDLYNKKTDEKMIRSLNKKIYNLIPIVEKRYKQIEVNCSEKLKSILEHFESMLSEEVLKEIDNYIYSNSDYKEYMFDKLKFVVEKNIIEKIKQINKPFKIDDLFYILPEYFRDENYLKLILSKHEDLIYSYTLSDDSIIYVTKQKSIIEYLNENYNIEDKEIKILSQRLYGDTLDAIGKNQNITRERVRQILIKIKNNFDESNKYFFEDIYSYIFTEYDTCINDFVISLGNNGNVVYNYLDFRYTKGEKNINLLLEDDNIPVQLKKEFEKAIYKDYLELGKDKVYISRNSISEYILKNLGSDGITFEEFQDLYFDVISKVKPEKLTNTLTTMDRGYLNKLANSEKILWNFGKFRYYNIRSKDFTELLETLNLEQYQNIEISTLKFIEDFPELMIKYDIRDQYELHNLLKKIYKKENVDYGRMPTIEFGTKNRQKQVLDLLFNLAPISKKDLASEYKKIYGIEVNTFLANYLDGFEMFMDGDILRIDFKFMPIEKQKKLMEILKEDFYFIDDIKKIYYNEFGINDDGEINTNTLQDMGFKIFSNYVLKNKYNYMSEYIRDIFERGDGFYSENVNAKLTASFYSELAKYKENYDVIEYSYRQYVNKNWLDKHNITKQMILEFVDNTLNSLKEEFFTIQWLIKNGIDYRFDKNLPDYFYSSLLVEQKDYVSYRQSTKVLLMYKGKGVKNISLSDFIMNYCLNNNLDSISLNKILDILVNDYGFNIEKHKLIEDVKESNFLNYNSVENIIILK